LLRTKSAPLRDYFDVVDVEEIRRAPIGIEFLFVDVVGFARLYSKKS
jgi:hypothetical protein